MRGTFTPKACTSPGFSVAARSLAPIDVFSMISHTARHVTTATSTTQPR